MTTPAAPLSHLAILAACFVASAATVQATVQWPEETRPRCVLDPRTCAWIATPDADRWEPIPVQPMAADNRPLC